MEFSKRGSSQVMDNDGKVWSFTHMATTPPFRFGYEPDSCEATTRPLGGSGGNNLCDLHSVYVKYPPYGVWDLRVVNWESIDLSAVTAVRFSFLLSTVPLDVARAPASDGVTIFAASDGQGTCITQADAGDCHQIGTGLATRPPPAPPPSTGTPPPPPALAPAGACSTGPEFMERSQAVTDACCGQAAGPCESGMPTSCDQECAAVLLPMQTDCSGFIVMMGLQDVIDTAVSHCQAPADPCTTGGEFMAYSGRMTAACCSDPSAACAAGFPTARCSSGCATVLLPMLPACDTFLTMMGMQAAAGTAMAICQSGH